MLLEKCHVPGLGRRVELPQQLSGKQTSCHIVEDCLQVEWLSKSVRELKYKREHVIIL